MLIEILTEIILPVFLLIGVGVLVQRLMPLDLSTLNKLTFHVFAPALVFLKLVETSLNSSSLGIVAAFSLLHLGLLLAISWKVFALPAYRAHRPALAMGAIFYNAGNYGFPFAQLAFGDFGVSIMAIILAIQVILNFTLGLWLLGANNGDWRAILKSVLRVPLLYAVLAALAMRALHLGLPGPLRLPLETLADGLIPTALVALGIQLAGSRAASNLRSLGTLVLTRLLFSPMLAAGMAAVWALVLPEQYRGAHNLVPVLIVGTGLPVAVNAYILCAEYRQDAELASQSVFWTTLLSAFSLAAWLAVV